MAFEELDFRYGKCNCKLYGLGDDYYCPECRKLFCFDCIEKHGCDVDIVPPNHLQGKWKVIEKESKKKSLNID